MEANNEEEGKVFMRHLIMLSKHLNSILMSEQKLVKLNSSAIVFGDITKIIT